MMKNNHTVVLTMIYKAKYITTPPPPKANTKTLLCVTTIYLIRAVTTGNWTKGLVIKEPWLCSSDENAFHPVNKSYFPKIDWNLGPPRGFTQSVILL